MTAVPTQLDHYTIDDLDRLTDDEQARYEVLNGSLHVTPPASYRHNRRAQRLGAVLAAAAPAGLEVLNTGTLLVQMGEDGLCPDVLVFVPGDYDKSIPVSEVQLVVEVTSPSNRSTDTVAKLDRYARAGVPQYWIVDPDEIVVHELDTEGVYRVAARGSSVTVTEPFAVSVTLD